MRMVEVYGSLLNPDEWKPIARPEQVSAVGTVCRTGWKLSFDKRSSRRHEAVLNLVETRDERDCFYTTIFNVTEFVFRKLADREIGPENAARFFRGEAIPPEFYRPVPVDSPYGPCWIFLIPEEGRRGSATTWDAHYVQIVKRGIEEMYPVQMREQNLRALRRAVEESAAAGARDYHAAPTPTTSRSP